MRFSETELLAGVALDLALGDPRWMPHPVRAIGWWISKLETGLNRGASRRVAGVFLWLLVVAPVAAAAWLTPWLSVYWIYSLLAIRSLDQETSRAVTLLAEGDLDGARTAVGMVVGRDTDSLDDVGVLRAATETLAENLSDAIVAPLFFLALGGPCAMAAYKAVNTLDSMVGYKNERYGDFGWFSARVDDWANLIPARLTAVLIWLCALGPGLHFGSSIRVSFRDAAKQPSPNSGWPEAAMAGALGVQLGGVNFYQGRERVKATIGDAQEPLSFRAYRKARVVLFLVSGLAVALTWSCSR